MNYRQSRLVEMLLAQAGYKKEGKMWVNNSIKSAFSDGELFQKESPSAPPVPADINEEAGVKYPDIENVGFNGTDGYGKYLNAHHTRLAERAAYIAGVNSRGQRDEGKLVETLKSLANVSEDTGREGCTYGDTDYDSMSVVYGYNMCVDYVREKANKALASHRSQQPSIPTDLVKRLREANPFRRPNESEFISWERCCNKLEQLIGKQGEATKEYGEWQLCPKCNGTKMLQPPYEVKGSAIVTGSCDVCNGIGMVARPIIPSNR